MAASETGKADDKSKGHQPTTWFHWLVLYPALGTSLLAAIPTVMQHLEAWRKDIKASELVLVKEQEGLWRRNLDCVAQASTWEVDGPRGLVIKITICNHTGDALLRYFTNEWAPQYKWVRAPEEGAKR